MATFNAVKRAGKWVVSKAEKVKAQVAAVGTGLMVLGAQAHAAVDPSVTDALTQAAVDVAVVASLAFAVYLAPKVFKYMRGGL